MKTQTLRFKSFTTTCSFVLLSIVVNAQITKVVTFTNGEVKQVTYENDPNRISRWEVKIFPIALGEAATDFFGIQILPKYRISDKFEFEGRFLSHYGSETNAITKPFLDVGATSHYVFFRKNTEKVKAVSVDYEGGSHPDQVLAYKVKFPVKKQYALMGDLGVGYTRYGSGLGYWIPDPETGEKIHYNGGHVTSFALNFGTSLQMTKSYRVRADSESRSYLGLGTISASLTYGLANNIAIYERQMIGSEMEFIDKTNEHTELSINALGWRVGIDQMLGIKNTGVGILYGLELGRLPMFSTPHPINGESVESSSFFFVIKLGLAIGSNPWK